MRIKIIFYVVLLTYLSLFFIMNIHTKIDLNFVFVKHEISLIMIFLVSLLLGGLVCFIISSKKIFHLKKAIRELKSGHENKK